MLSANCPLDYSLCDQTVTLYRKQGDSVLRQVVEGCLFRFQDSRTVDAMGCRQDRPFLLVMPGAPQRVFPGDRVMAGLGPEVTAQMWRDFIPVKVPGLGEVSYAAPYFWEGSICHVEAGRR